jgi:hypothetical protein
LYDERTTDKCPASVISLVCHFLTHSESYIDL